MPAIATYALEDSATIDIGVVDLVRIGPYRRAAKQLYPLGRAWDFEDDTFDSLLSALAREPSRIELRGYQMLAEGPSTATEMLAEWEAALGLPIQDFEPSTVASRRAAIVAKLVTRGSLNITTLATLLTALGYDSFQVFRLYDPFIATSECTHALQGEEGYWLDAWRLEVPTPLTGSPDATLEALIRSYLPAHNVVIFEYV